MDSKESILSAYVALRAGTSNRNVVPARRAGNRFMGSFKSLQIQAQANMQTCNELEENNGGLIQVRRQQKR
jgi:hypothetical protein